MAWQTPKQNWTAADGVTMDDMNRIEGNNQANKDNIASLQQNLDAHKSDTSSHITPTERATWNAKQAALGYVPVQQGGGTDQLGNKVYIGWTGSELKAQVDDVDLGKLLTQSDYNQLFQYANDGKTGIANAVTAKGVAASPTDTFATLASKIGQINTGKKFASGTVTSSTTTLGFRDEEDGTVNMYYVNVSYNFGFTPRIILVTVPGEYTIFSNSRFFRDNSNDIYCLCGQDDYVYYFQDSTLFANSTGFLMPVINDGIYYGWEAYE